MELEELPDYDEEEWRLAVPNGSVVVTPTLYDYEHQPTTPSGIWFICEYRRGIRRAVPTDYEDGKVITILREFAVKYPLESLLIYNGNTTFG